MWSKNGKVLQELEAQGIVRVIDRATIWVNQWGSVAGIAELALPDSEVVFEEDVDFD
jgi:hypothetical protein